MTQPRRHIAGQVVHLVRRCFQRRFLLRPDAFINRVIAYEVARASERHGQAIYGVMAMSNHIHQISADTTGERSGYMRDAMREISRARNYNLKRRDSLWDGRPFGDTVLLDRDAIERQLVYLWTNPVAAGLVKRVKDWPGFKILPRHWGKTLWVRRPRGYHGRKSPEYVKITPLPPPGYEEMTLSEVRRHFERLIREAEEKIHGERKGKRIIGKERVCGTDPFSCPRDLGKDRGGASPRFASKNRVLRERAEGRHQGFQDSYQRQRLKWRNGGRSSGSVRFPCGTVQLRKRAPIRCDPPDEDEPGLFVVRSLGA